MILRVIEKSLEDTIAISQESILLFKTLKEKYPSLITELNDKKNKLRIPDWRGKFDALIPELKLFLEYDGSYWHKEDAHSDIEKTKNAFKWGYKVIRIRQEPLPLLFKKNDVLVPSKFNLSIYREILINKIENISQVKHKVKE